jgi:hypothetical protein
MNIVSSAVLDDDLPNLFFLLDTLSALATDAFVLALKRSTTQKKRLKFNDLKKKILDSHNRHLLGH